MSDLVCAQTYYVDNIIGADHFSGLSVATPWKTLQKINQHRFFPDDIILLKRGCVWEEMLIVTSSGVPNAPIVFSAYGTGPTPKIKCSNRYDDWVLKEQKNGLFVWQGKIKGIRNYWGAILGGVRIPAYRGYPVENFEYSIPSDLTEMHPETFFSPHNRALFFLKTHIFQKPVCEIGVREYGILIQNQSWLRFENIEIYGPGGKKGTGGSKYSYQMLIDNSHNIVVRNCAFRLHHRHGIMVSNQSSEIVLAQVLSEGHGNTGIYFWEAGSGNEVLNSTVSSCGKIASDRGDLGLIGIFKTPHVRISNSVVMENGHPGIQTIDAAISFVQSPYGIIEGCTISNSGGTGVQFAANSDYGLAAYNVIHQWGLFYPENSSEGIRIGGGKGDTSAFGCRIYNNLLTNRQCNGKNRAAIRIEKRNNSGLKIMNNIFDDNLECLKIFAESGSNFEDWEISHNYFYSTQTLPFKIKKESFSNIPRTIGKSNILSSNPPGIDLEKKSLLPASPCIDTGTDVGYHKDYNGNEVKAVKIDIGPFEFYE